VSDGTAAQQDTSTRQAACGKGNAADRVDDAAGGGECAFALRLRCNDCMVSSGVTIPSCRLTEGRCLRTMHRSSSADRSSPENT
jgi:hypothetical protein